MSGLVDDLFDRSITDCKGLDITSGKPFRSCCFFAQAGAPSCHILMKAQVIMGCRAKGGYCASKKRRIIGLGLSVRHEYHDFAS